MSSETRPRVAAGVRAGGQFAPAARAETTVSLPAPATYDFTDALAEHGVPSGLLHGVDARGREILLDQIESQGLDRQGARDVVTSYQEWWTSSDTGPLYLGRAFSLEKASGEQLREALAVRNRLTVADGIERIEEAELDVMGSWRRWQLAREDLRVLAGEPGCSGEAIARATDPDYRGQLMPYPPSDAGGPVPRVGQMAAELEAAGPAQG